MVLRNDERARVFHQRLRKTVDQCKHLLFLCWRIQRDRIDEADLGEIASLFFLDLLTCQVVTWQGGTLISPTKDGELGARPSYRAANALRFPIRITRLQTTGSQTLSFLGRYLVIGDQDATALTTIGGIEEVDRV